LLRTAMQVIAVFLLFANAARAEPRASIVSELQALHNEVAEFMSLEKEERLCRNLWEDLEPKTCDDSGKKCDEGWAQEAESKSEPIKPFQHSDGCKLACIMEPIQLMSACVNYPQFNNTEYCDTLNKFRGIQDPANPKQGICLYVEATKSELESISPALYTAPKSGKKPTRPVNTVIPPEHASKEGCLAKWEAFFTPPPGFVDPHSPAEQEMWKKKAADYFDANNVCLRLPNQNSITGHKEGDKQGWADCSAQWYAFAKGKGWGQDKQDSAMAAAEHHWNKYQVCMPLDVNFADPAPFEVRSTVAFDEMGKKATWLNCWAQWMSRIQGGVFPDDPLSAANAPAASPSAMAADLEREMVELVSEAEDIKQELERSNVENLQDGVAARFPGFQASGAQWPGPVALDMPKFQTALSIVKGYWDKTEDKMTGLGVCMGSSKDDKFVAPEELEYTETDEKGCMESWKTYTQTWQDGSFPADKVATCQTCLGGQADQASVKNYFIVDTGLCVGPEQQTTSLTPGDISMMTIKGLASSCKASPSLAPTTGEITRAFTDKKKCPVPPKISEEVQQLLDQAKQADVVIPPPSPAPVAPADFADF